MRLYEIRETPAALLRRAAARQASDTREEERRELLDALAAAGHRAPMYLLRHALR